MWGAGVGLVAWVLLLVVYVTRRPVSAACAPSYVRSTPRCTPTLGVINSRCRPRRHALRAGARCKAFLRPPPAPQLGRARHGPPPRHGGGQHALAATLHIAKTHAPEGTKCNGCRVLLGKMTLKYSSTRRKVPARDVLRRRRRGAPPSHACVARPAPGAARAARQRMPLSTRW